VIILEYVKKPINKLTSDFVRTSRKKLGVTQEGLAMLLGKARSTVAKYETGEINLPGDAVLQIQGFLSSKENN